MVSVSVVVVVNVINSTIGVAVMWFVTTDVFILVTVTVAVI